MFILELKKQLLEYYLDANFMEIVLYIGKTTKKNLQVW